MDFGIQQFGILVLIVPLNIYVKLSQFLNLDVKFFIRKEGIGYLIYKALLETKWKDVHKASKAGFPSGVESQEMLRRSLGRLCALEGKGIT